MIKHYLAAMLITLNINSPLLKANNPSLITHTQVVDNEMPDLAWNLCHLAALHSPYKMLIRLASYGNFYKNTLLSYQRTMLGKTVTQKTIYWLLIARFLGCFECAYHDVRISDRSALIANLNKNTRLGLNQKKFIAKQIVWIIINSAFPHLALAIKNIIDNKTIDFTISSVSTNSLYLAVLSSFKWFSEYFRLMHLYNQILNKCAQNRKENNHEKNIAT